MIQPAVDRPNILTRLEPLTRLVGRALIKATRSSKDFFRPGRPFDPVLFATLVRYFVRQDLASQRIHVVDEDVPTFNAQSLPNIGLQITYDGFVIKILKSVDHLLPVPSSRPKSEFYHQQMTFIVDEKSGDTRTSELNLVYLWDCDADHALVEFQVACPKSGSETRASVTAHWYEPLQVPDVGAIAQESDDIAALEDLEITMAQDEINLNSNERR